MTAFVTSTSQLINWVFGLLGGSRGMELRGALEGREWEPVANEGSQRFGTPSWNMYIWTGGNVS